MSEQFSDYQYDPSLNAVFSHGFEVSQKSIADRLNRLERDIEQFKSSIREYETKECKAIADLRRKFAETIAVIKPSGEFLLPETDAHICRYKYMVVAARRSLIPKEAKT